MSSSPWGSPWLHKFGIRETVVAFIVAPPLPNVWTHEEPCRTDNAALHSRLCQHVIQQVCESLCVQIWVHGVRLVHSWIWQMGLGPAQGWIGMQQGQMACKVKLVRGCSQCVGSCLWNNTMDRPLTASDPQTDLAPTWTKFGHYWPSL